MHIEKFEVLTNPHTALSRAKGIRVAEWLVAHKADVVLVQENLKHKGPSYVLANAGVQIRQVKAKTLADALKAR